MMQTIHLLASNLPPFEWAYQHMALVTWPTLLGVGVRVAWKVSKYFEHATTVATKAADQINTLATNHFPHMEASLSRQDVLLTSIDHNIGRMADKL